MKLILAFSFFLLTHLNGFAQVPLNLSPASQSLETHVLELKTIIGNDNPANLPTSKLQAIMLKTGQFWGAIKPEIDSVTYGVTDYWASPFETLIRGKGDCEDFTIGAFYSLYLAGIPAESMQMVVAPYSQGILDRFKLKLHPSLSIDSLHVVLLVQTDQTALILDSVIPTHLQTMKEYHDIKYEIVGFNQVRVTPNPELLPLGNHRWNFAQELFNKQLANLPNKDFFYAQHRDTVKPTFSWTPGKGFETSSIYNTFDELQTCATHQTSLSELSSVWVVGN